MTTTSITTEPRYGIRVLPSDRRPRVAPTPAVIGPSVRYDDLTSVGKTQWDRENARIKFEDGDFYGSEFSTASQRAGER
jgi:hypothetical protein